MASLSFDGKIPSWNIKLIINDRGLQIRYLHFFRKLWDILSKPLELEHFNLLIISMMSESTKELGTGSWFLLAHWIPEMPDRY